MNAQILAKLLQIMTTNGLQVSSYATIKAGSGSMRLEMKPDNKKARITFSDPKPVVQIHKIIKVSPRVNAVVLTDSGIDIDLDNFPDVSLTYDELKEYL